jgi:hypothetical protein
MTSHHAAASRGSHTLATAAARKTNATILGAIVRRQGQDGSARIAASQRASFAHPMIVKWTFVEGRNPGNEWVSSIQHRRGRLGRDQKKKQEADKHKPSRTRGREPQPTMMAEPELAGEEEAAAEGNDRPVAISAAKV